MRSGMKVLIVLGLVGSVAAGALAQATAPAEPKTEPKSEPAKVEPAKTEPVPAKAEAAKLEFVQLTTTLGDIVLELNAEKAPITVANFLSYVDKGFYNGTVFHRVIPTFMIQGGGFDKDMNQKSTDAPIKNEFRNGLKNVRGTIAMARLNTPDSATAQFFINVVDNANLDAASPMTGGAGYAVFGRVVVGMDVVDKIRYLPTGVKARMPDVPNDLPVITAAKRLTKDEANSKVNAGNETKPAETKPADGKPAEEKPADKKPQ
jgi:cyclophilin family peptidyl-prolyl cis-trans isomerase